VTNNSHALSLATASAVLLATTLTLGWLMLRLRREHGMRLEQVEQVEHERNGALQLLADREELQRRLAHSATHDPLTGLANRTLLLQRIAESLAAGGEAPHCAVLFLDLDDFKAVNDELGHAAGDQLLQTVAARLLASVREQDMVARLGGDEFALLFPELSSKGAEAVLARVLSAVGSRVVLRGRERHVGASAGLAFGRAGDDAVRLVGKADLAMYRAKADGGGGLALFQEQMHHELASRLSLEADVGQAVERRELRVVYQPLVSLDDGRLLGFEALLRWRHPTRGLVPPDVFIPVAESSGEIDRIGQWVLRESLAQLRHWQQHLGRDLTMAVNLSTRQLEDPDLPELVRAAIQHSGVDPRTLTLEVTESLAVETGSPALERLWQLKALGVRLALDDFGTGHSSLGRLGAMPIDKVKIDKSFVSPLVAGDAGTKASAVLLRAAVGMALGLGLRVVAEGVESPEHLALLRHLGCHEAQGYHLGRPADAETIDVISAQWQMPPADDRLLQEDAGAVVPRLMPSIGIIPGARRDAPRTLALHN